MNYELGVKQIDALIKTMTEAKQDDNAELAMDDWIAPSACGTVACICGHQVLSDLLLFPNALELVSENRPSVVASGVSGDLKLSLGNLAVSIYSSTKYARTDFARRSSLFTESEINSFGHLNKDKPSFDDVIKYLNAVKEKIQ